MAIGNAANNQSSRWLVLGLIVFAVAYRIAASRFDFLGNTSPLMAVAFGGALLLGSRFWWVPVAALVASDILLGLLHGGGGIGGYTLMSTCFYLFVAGLAGRIGGAVLNTPTLWFGTLACSVAFYVVANTYSFLAWPGYEKSLAGWWQSQTTGVPGVQPPAWMFLRNALLADTIWVGLATLAVILGARREARLVVA